MTDEEEIITPPVGPYAVQLPSDRANCQVLLEMLKDKQLAVRNVALCISQDPALVLHILEEANKQTVGGRLQEVTTLSTAVVSLGVSQLKTLIEEVLKDHVTHNKEVTDLYEHYTQLAVRTAYVARIIARVVLRSVADDAFIMGQFGFLGDMLAILYFQDDYVALYQAHKKRSKINYYLHRNHSFELEEVQITYLINHKIPTNRCSLFARDGETITPEGQKLKSIYFCAVEMVEAFGNEKFEIYAPNGKLPSKSYLRLLKLNDMQHKKLFEELEHYLTTGTEINAEPQGPPQFLESEGGPAEPTKEEAQPEPISSTTTAAELDEPSPAEELSEDSSSIEPDIFKYDPQVIAQSDTDIEKEVREQETPAVVVVGPSAKPKRIAPPNNHYAIGIVRTETLIAPFNQIIDDAESVEELLEGILDLLIEKGYFERTAILATQHDTKRTYCVVGRGPIPEGDNSIIIEDEFSPLNRRASKVESFASEKNTHSPFGSRAYALAPLEIIFEHPVALYADCGDGVMVTFDARRVFRSIIEMINDRLPELPGSVPTELT